MVGIVVAAGMVLWTFRVQTPSTPPTIYYAAHSGLTYPVWGDPTDCMPNLPYSWTYYLGNGSHDPRYSTYMHAWWNDCEYSNNGTYNRMNATAIIFTQVSQPISLADIQFSFVCFNSTPSPMTTYLVQGSLQSMSWFPGSSQSISTNAPKLGSCGTFNASGYGGGAFSVYYNRLGFFQTLTANATLLAPGDTFILYIHSAGSVLEAPSPIERASTWGHPDFDDFHGAPSWCFTTPGACSIRLIDTGVTPATLLAIIPIYTLHQ